MKPVLKIFILLFSIFIISCSRNSNEEKLIGKWYDRDEGEVWTEFEFTEDSLRVSDFMGIQKGLWKADENEIVFQRIYLLDGDYIPQNFKLKYKLFDSGKSLFLKIQIDSVDWEMTLIKADNKFDYIQKKKDISIRLPSTDKSLTDLGMKFANFNIYVGKDSNNILKVKTDFSNSLDSLEFDLKKVVDVRPEMQSRLRFVIIADEKTTNIQLDSIQNYLKSYLDLDTYRVFKTDSIDQFQFLHYYGLKK